MCFCQLPIKYALITLGILLLYNVVFYAVVQ